MSRLRLRASSPALVVSFVALIVALAASELEENQAYRDGPPAPRRSVALVILSRHEISDSRGLLHAQVEQVAALLAARTGRGSADLGPPWLSDAWRSGGTVFRKRDCVLD